MSKRRSDEPGGVKLFFIALAQLVYSPFREAVICIAAIPFVLLGANKASNLWNTNIFIYIGAIAAVVLSVFPAMIFAGIFLLWWNPEKYKEKGMKEFRKQREGERSEAIEK